MFLNDIHFPSQNTAPNDILLPDGLSYLNKILNTFSGIYAIYPLNETTGITAEEVVNNYDGTLNGPTLNAIAGPGPSMGNAAFYDGLVDYCQLPAASLDGPFDSNLGTMMIWLKVANAGVWTDGSTRVGIVLGTDNNNHITIIQDTPNAIQYRFRAGGVTAQRNGTSSSVNWLCFGITWNKISNRVRAYLDGIQQGADMAYTGVWVGSLANSFCQVCAFTGLFKWHGYPSFLMLSSAEADAAQMAAGAIAA